MLDLGAKLDVVDTSVGKSVLHYVVPSDTKGELTSWLMQLKKAGRQDIDVNIMTIGKVTPLMLAVQYNHEAVVKALLFEGEANPFLKDNMN